MDNASSSITPTPPIEQPVVQITIPEESPITKNEAIKENVDNSHTHKWRLYGTVARCIDCKEEKPITKSDKVGRPCKYCLNREYYQKIAEEYLKTHEETDKPKIPFIEELALKMRIDDETLALWAHKLKKDSIDEYGDPELEHPELSATYALLKTTQKFRLKQRAMGRYNPVGALSLLRFDHGAIETSKQVHAGDPNEPLQITIVEEDRHVAQED